MHEIVEIYYDKTQIGVSTFNLCKIYWSLDFKKVFAVHVYLFQVPNEHTGNFLLGQFR